MKNKKTTHIGTHLFTLQSDAVHGESSSQLSGHFHTAADQSLPKHMFEGLVEVLTVTKLADHGDCVLQKICIFPLNRIAKNSNKLLNKK